MYFRTVRYVRSYRTYEVLRSAEWIASIYPLKRFNLHLSLVLALILVIVPASILTLNVVVLVILFVVMI